MKILNFEVGKHRYTIRFVNEADWLTELLPSHAAFLVEESDENPLFELTVTNDLPLSPEGEFEAFGPIKGDNGIYEVARYADGSYHLRISCLDSRLAAVFVCDGMFRHCRVMLCSDIPTVRRYGMDNSVLIAFAYAGIYRNVLLIHASVAVVDGRAYAFLGKSGTGKSTHCELWLKHIKGASCLNDDNPVVEILSDGTIWLYGSPWSGKTPIYKHEGYRAGGFLRLHQASVNSIRRLNTLEAYASMLGTVNGMIWDNAQNAAIRRSIITVVDSAACYDMCCLPDKEAARMSFAAMTSDVHP